MRMIREQIQNRIGVNEFSAFLIGICAGGYFGARSLQRGRTDLWHVNLMAMIMMLYSLISGHFRQGNQLTIFGLSFLFGANSVIKMMNDSTSPDVPSVLNF